MNKTTEKLGNFVAAWQIAKSVEDVADVLNLKPATVRTKAARLRKLGVQLKEIDARAVDVDALNAIATTTGGG